MIIGIDYSLTCPSICKIKTSTDFPSVDIRFLTSNKKHSGVYANIRGDMHMDWNSHEQRHENIATWVMLNIQPQDKITHIYIEDYAFAAKGRVFNIAENTGLMKYFLYRAGLPFTVLAPSVIKKYATGKGNADKNLMEDTFQRHTGLDLHKVLGINRLAKIGSPVSDIIDSYYIGIYGNYLHCNRP